MRGYLEDMGSVCLCQMYLEAEDTVEGAEVPDGSIGHGEVVLRHGSGAAFVTWQRRPCVCGGDNRQH